MGRMRIGTPGLRLFATVQKNPANRVGVVIHNVKKIS